eukprot:m.203796 g.203796  ORF g.203796 m.203796 type:complete len:359 (-) comp15768_c0_seq12:182-1258(-)
MTFWSKDRSIYHRYRTWFLMKLTGCSSKFYVCVFISDNELFWALSMGFEPQIRKIIEHTPRDRQTLFYTATWPKEVRRIASEFLNNPVVIYVGDCDDLRANQDITQIVHVVRDLRRKDDLLNEIITKEGQGARILIFCSTKRMCDQLERNLRYRTRCAAIHGDKDQIQRTRTLEAFKNGSSPIMIATDVAARGLDIKDVRAVVNYDFPTNVEDYVHRIGRTGRAGNKGNAYTFFETKDSGRASELIKVMEDAGSKVPDELRQMSSRTPQMRGSAMQFSGGGSGGYGGHDNRGYNGGGRGNDGYSRRRSRSPDRRGRSRSRERRRRSYSRSASRSRSPRGRRSRSPSRSRYHSDSRDKR